MQNELVNRMIGDEELIIHKPSSDCVASCGKWKGKPVTLVKFPDLLSLTEKKMGAEVKSCKSLCYPGPNALLLVVNPSNSSEEHRKKINSILSLFGPDALKHSMVVINDVCLPFHPFHPFNYINLSALISDCGGRSYRMYGDYEELMMKIEDILKENEETISLNEESTRVKEPQVKVKELETKTPDLGKYFSCKVRF